MNRKKIHKILLKLGLTLCIVGQLALQISIIASGQTLITSLPINPFGTNTKYKVEYRVKSNDTVNMKHDVTVSKDNKHVKVTTMINNLNQYGEKNMLTGKVGGEYKIHGWYQNRLNNLAKGYNKEINIFSGYRSYELQKELFNNSDKTGKTVASAGNSRHQVGLAVDIDSKWVKELNNDQLAKYGLYKPMDYEDWHIEPVETKGMSTQQLMNKYGTPCNTQFAEEDKTKEKKTNTKSLIQLIVQREMQRIDKLSSQNK